MNVGILRRTMERAGLDAVVLFSPINIRYFSKFYITDGAAVITQTNALMVTDSRYIEAAKSQVDEMNVVMYDNEHHIGDLIKSALSGCKNVGAEEMSLPHAEWIAWEKRLGVSLIPSEQIIKELRAIKTPYELESIIAAQRIAEAALQDVMEIIRPGLSERELAAELSYRMMLHGGEGNSFDPIVVTGPKSSMPHGVPGDEVVHEGDFLTMDFGCIKNGYCSDMTRTVAIGYATDEMQNVYETVLRAQLAGIELAKAGVTGADIHNAGAKVIADAGYGAFFGHGFGHSLGLEIHESPRASTTNVQPISEGVIVTAEPGIYLPGKFGVRIEDMIYITSDGCLNLTKAPKCLLILK